MLGSKPVQASSPSLAWSLPVQRTLLFLVVSFWPSATCWLTYQLLLVTYSLLPYLTTTSRGFITNLWCYQTMILLQETAQIIAIIAIVQALALAVNIAQCPVSCYSIKHRQQVLQAAVPCLHCCLGIQVPQSSCLLPFILLSPARLFHLLF